MDNNELLKELFFIWQERTEYKESNIYYKKIIQFMNENLTKAQMDELEDLLVRDTFENMFEAFTGGFDTCQKLLMKR